MVLTRYVLIAWTKSMSRTARQNATGSVRFQAATMASRPSLRLSKKSIATRRNRLLANAIQFNRRFFGIQQQLGQMFIFENRCRRPARIQRGGSAKTETF